jgi:hypothetical protein
MPQGRKAALNHMLRTGLYTAADIQVMVLFLHRRIRYTIGMKVFKHRNSISKKILLCRYLLPAVFL